MSLLGYGLIVLGAVLGGMGLLSRKWGQRTWQRTFLTGLILVAADIYLLFYSPA